WPAAWQDATRMEESASDAPLMLGRSEDSAKPLDPKAQMDADKNSIYSHPLFPLLRLMMLRCEEATQGAEGITSAGLSAEIQAMLGTQSELFSGNGDTDSLMLKAVQVLRIHLLELEKVRELCQDFCERYIACLRGKLSSDNLLRGDAGPASSQLDPQINHVEDIRQGGGRCLRGAAGRPMGSDIYFSLRRRRQGRVDIFKVAFSYVSAGKKKNPASVITCRQRAMTVKVQCVIQVPNTQAECDLSESDDRKMKSKRGVLPKHATGIMRSWLFQHIVHPYPTEDEKRQIAAQTNLTLLQVNNW
uniref:Pbx/knotted 1 homeobox 2 n=1 Tax=Petromyzon marinus TaxID=7757 RepID=S4RLM6_PETMA